MSHFHALLVSMAYANSGKHSGIIGTTTVANTMGPKRRIATHMVLFPMVLFRGIIFSEKSSSLNSTQKACFRITPHTLKRSSTRIKQRRILSNRYAGVFHTAIGSCCPAGIPWMQEGIDQQLET